MRVCVCKNEFSPTGTRQHIRLDRNHMNSIEELSTFFNQFHPIHGNSLDDMMGLKNGICNNNSVKSDNGNITSFPIHMFDLDMNCNLILQGRIGQGFYGEVFKATIEWVDDDGRNKDEPELVAVKKLKKMHLETDVNDFEREIEIMKVTFMSYTTPSFFFKNKKVFQKITLWLLIFLYYRCFAKIHNKTVI